MSKVDDIYKQYIKINEVNWQNVKNAAKTAGSHALDIATGGISTAVTDTIDAARGKDTGSQIDNLQSQVDQQAQDAGEQAAQEAEVDKQQAAGIEKAQGAADALNQTQEKEIDTNQQQITAMGQRIGKVEQLIQQVQQQLGGQPGKQQPAQQQPVQQQPAQQQPAQQQPAQQ